MLVEPTKEDLENNIPSLSFDFVHNSQEKITAFIGTPIVEFDTETVSIFLDNLGEEVFDSLTDKFIGESYCLSRYTHDLFDSVSSVVRAIPYLVHQETNSVQNVSQNEMDQIVAEAKSLVTYLLDSWTLKSIFPYCLNKHILEIRVVGAPPSVLEAKIVVLAGMLSTFMNVQDGVILQELERLQQ